MTLQHITPLFKMPEGYSRTFVFQSGLFSAVITATEGGFHLHSSSPFIGQLPAFLDWCQEVEQSVKKEIGMLPDKAA